MTTAPQNEPHDPTHADGGNVGTTLPQAANQGNTQPDAVKEAQPDIDKIVQKRLERERKKWEAEREEVEKRARMDEAERLKADIADRDKRIAEAEAKAVRAERLAELTGKVVDPNAALRLWEEDDTLDTFLKRHPYMAPAPARAVDIPGSKSASQPEHLKPEDFKGKSEAWIAENLHRLKPPAR